MTGLEGKQMWTAKFCGLSKFQPHKSHALLLRFHTSPDVVCDVLLFIIFCCDNAGVTGSEHFMVSLGACIPNSDNVSSSGVVEMGGNVRNPCQ